MTDRVDGYETCPSGHRFPYMLVHNCFNDTAYAYCDSCGITTLLGGWDDTRRPAAAPLRIQGPIQIETEPWLESCACGGHFTANAEPRCPECRVTLSAEGASTFIENNAPGTRLEMAALMARHVLHRHRWSLGSKQLVVARVQPTACRSLARRPSRRRSPAVRHACRVPNSGGRGIMSATSTRSNPAASIWTPSVSGRSGGPVAP
jgi:hypothetical protein